MRLELAFLPTRIGLYDLWSVWLESAHFREGKQMRTSQMERGLKGFKAT
jgi:hypothetical protein